MKKGKNYEKYNKMIADKLNEGIYKTPPDFEKIQEFAKAMSELLFMMRAESDISGNILTTPNTDKVIPQEFVEKLIDDQVHSTAMKIIIENDIINYLTQCPEDYKNDKGEYEYQPDVYDYAYAIDSYIERMYEDLHETKQVMVCTNCGSDNVQTKMWVKANTNEVIDSCGDGDSDDNWCDDCQGHHDLDARTVKPSAKIIGFQVNSIDGAGHKDIHQDMEASFCIYNLTQARQMVNNVDGTTEYNELIAIWDDDVEEPTFMFEGDPRD